MRFLCFHGGGTNANIFEAQMARIYQAIQHEHEFVFINGAISTIPATGYADSGQEFLRFCPDDLEIRSKTVSGLSPEDIDYLKEFHGDLAAYMTTHGPFDGVVGYCEGGGVAASLTVGDLQYPFSQIKCGIFFCSPAPIDPRKLETGQSRALDVATDGQVVAIPTAHIWSSNDVPHPDMGKALSRLCDDGVKEEFIHRAGHVVPGMWSDEGVIESILVIERTIERAKVFSQRH